MHNTIANNSDIIATYYLILHMVKIDIPSKTLGYGFTMPVYGLGTWQMGGRKEVDPANDDQADIDAIKVAIDSGIIHIDTAENYAAGHTEELVAQAIKAYDRSKLLLVSKVSSGLLKHDDVIQSCKNSLRRLGTDYLDIFLIHKPSTTIPLEETMAAFDELKQHGLIKEIGISNASTETLTKAQSLTKNKIVCNQVHYNLQVREPETSGLLKHCQENDVLIVAYRPVEKAALLDVKNPLLDELATKYNKTYSQLAINWLISQPSVVTLSKTRNVEHLQENLGAIGWQMEAVDIERLRNEYNNLQPSSVGPLV